MIRNTKFDTAIQLAPITILFYRIIGSIFTMILTAPAIWRSAAQQWEFYGIPKHNHRTTRYVFIFGESGSRDTGYEIVYQLRPAGIVN